MSVVKYKTNSKVVAIDMPKSVWRVVQVPGTYNYIAYKELVLAITFIPM